MDLPNERIDGVSCVVAAGGDASFEAPKGSLESAIAEVWREVFRVERIGRNDNFFGLGGNSLLGMELTDLLAQRLSLELPVFILFQYPTVREIAQIARPIDSQDIP